MSIPSFNIPQIAPTGPMTFLQQPGGIASLSQYGPTSPLARGLGGVISAPGPLPAFNPGVGQAILQDLPFARPAINGLASQVPAGAGREALGAANALRPAGTSIGSRLGGQAATRAAGLAGRFANPVLTKGALAKAGGWGLLGMAGSTAIDKFLPVAGHNSNVEQALQGAAQGAGIGAGVGSIFPGIGTGIGAGVGAVAGGAIGILGNMLGWGGGGEEEAKASPKQILSKAIATTDLDPTITEEILTIYGIQMTLAEGAETDEQKEALEQQAYEQAGQMILAALTTRDQATSAASNTLALQAQSQEIFGPIAQDIRDSSMMYANAMKGIMGDLPEDYRAIAQLQTARELTSADRLANAYMAQAAIAPTVNQLTQYQQDYNSFAAQQFSRAMNQQMGGAAPSYGASAQDIQALLTP